MELQNIVIFLKSLPTQVRRQNVITNHYKMLWEKKRGVQNSSYFECLPNPLKYEISVDTRIGLLQTSTLFQDKPDAFLRMVSYLVKHEFYQPGALIYHRNCTKNKMVASYYKFFIHSFQIFVVVGSVDILSDEDDESPVITFRHGTCLGESSLVLTLPSKNSIQARSYTELQVSE